MRLNAYLARAGVASRRKADALIKDGRVRVNGEPGRLDSFVTDEDVVEVDGDRVLRQKLAYVLLHKPAGVVTTASDPHGRPTVVGLVDAGVRVVPVGRLDADTTGAILLTNDGALAHRLAHPRYEVDKVYEVEVEGEPDAAALRALAEGVELEDGRTAPAQCTSPRALAYRVDASRGPQAAGEAHVRRRRLSRHEAPSQPLRGPRSDGARYRGVARADTGRGRRAPAASRRLTKPIRRTSGRASVQRQPSPSRLPPRATAAARRRRRERVVALLDRGEQLDDRLGDVRLERPVTLRRRSAPRSPRPTRPSRRRVSRSGSRPRLLRRVVVDLAPRVRDGRLELPADHVRLVDHPDDALRRSARRRHQALGLLEVLDRARRSPGYTPRGTTNVSPKRWLKRSAMLRASSSAAAGRRRSGRCPSGRGGCRLPSGRDS